MSRNETELDWTFPYSSQRMPVLGENVVATSQPLAAQAGLRTLAAVHCTRRIPLSVGSLGHDFLTS